MKPLNEKIVNMIWGESSAALPGNSISVYHFKKSLDRKHYFNELY